MSNLRVNTSALAGVAGELDCVADELRTGLGSLDAEVSGLLGRGWSGEAAAAFDGVWRYWHAGSQLVVEGLMTMSALVQDALGQYEDTDAAAASAVAGAGR